MPPPQCQIYSWVLHYSSVAGLPSLQYWALAGHVQLLRFNEKKKDIWEKVGSLQSNNKIKDLPQPDSDKNFCSEEIHASVNG